MPIKVPYRRISCWGLACSPAVWARWLPTPWALCEHVSRHVLVLRRGVAV